MERVTKANAEGLADTKTISHFLSFFIPLQIVILETDE